MTPSCLPHVPQGRVLLVEDDPDAALFFTHVLTRRGGFDITHVADPALALDLALLERWDLVVADYDLPGMTGLDLLAALRAAAPALPVVLVTAQDPRLLPPYLPALLKPVRPAHLVTTAATLIG